MRHIINIFPVLLAALLSGLAGAWAQADPALYLPAGSVIEAQGYDSHVELRWQSVPGAQLYRVVVVSDGGEQVRAETGKLFYMDFITSAPAVPQVYTYKVVEVGTDGGIVGETPQVQATVRRFSDDELMAMVQQYTLRYFVEFADPLSGMAFERSDGPRPNCVTTGGTGFGIMAIVAGVENGFITREDAVGRIGKIVTSLENFPRFHGAWAHWYDSSTGRPYHFSAKDNGGDLVETAFLMQGLLAAQGYFDGEAPAEAELGRRIEKLWREVEWDHYTQGQDALYWHWSPEHGFEMNHRIQGYDETLITYILAASSPTHPISRRVYESCWVNRKDGEFLCQTDFYGILLPLGKRMQMGGPLFWVHYSYIGLCPKGLRDRYANYWEQNRRYTLVNRAYCIDNPYGWTGYGEDFWGLTASDALPRGYRAHSPGIGNDTGTVAPTGALSSLPYTPQESLAVLKNLYRNLGQLTFGPFGFYDAVNLGMEGEKTTGSYLAIDQGPIVGMIENHRHGTLWNAFMKNADIRAGLDKLGFTYENN
ncbi:MAG: beta-glucosidase [Alistipes sp.]|nr:beta-glucosidase [Alistipes sp.]